MATTYWVDTTEADELRERYVATRPVLAVLMVDNYEDLMKACADTARSAVLAQIDEKLNSWAACADGLLLKTSGTTTSFFEERHYEHFAEEKFSVLDTIRDIKVGDGDADPLHRHRQGRRQHGELYKNANLSLEMALSRGGDQAVVRGKVDFAFYGGRSKTTEKRTKVKSRVMANALSELMADATRSISWATASRTWTPWAPPQAFAAPPGSGASGPRSSSIWSTTPPGRCCKAPGLPEYAGVFVTAPNEAFLKMRPGALLIVVDTNRPDMVESHSCWSPATGWR
ncbi:MAG: hypothetical protein V8R40_02665 [Dysosmobacter sp.]